MRCAVFASGGGSNFQALLDRKVAGDLHVEFVLVIGNNSNVGAFEKAQKFNIPLLHIASSHFPNEKEYVDALITRLKQSNVELIILAGYMKKLPCEIVSMYRNRIVNVHPGLLPAFGGKGMYGSRVHQAVLDYGAKISGVTIHFVDEEYDHGPIIMQEIVKVYDDDNAEKLAARVLKVEHDTLWRAIEKIAQGKIALEGRRVIEHG